MLFFLLILALLALYFWMVAPSGGCKRARKWGGTAFAHRGLHNDVVSENSLGAFEAACNRGFGIELDVQLTRDGRLVVFHDDNLQRMTGDTRRVDALDFDQLQALPLPDGSRIPAFEAVLRCVDGRVPLLVELKNGKQNQLLCQKTLECLRGYKGPYIVESFNPMILRWFKQNAPEIIRGQLVSEKASYMPDFSVFVAVILSNLALNMLARPDFVAYDVSAEGFYAPRIQRKLFSTPLAAWTVTDSNLYDELIDRGEMPIFEGFLPNENNRRGSNEPGN